AMLSAYIENDGLSDTELEQLRTLLSVKKDK
ncbi:MAG: BlaI/MecI/CopY family transcriptional regulator, partial [Dorea sp.]|nr:BlaI/MecI/CopY family transcriptional regulator [Dorea sp.]MCI9454858.1 BlaI/MecI/CopY family transcriptional regulator [Dorea sp.]